MSCTYQSQWEPSLNDAARNLQRSLDRLISKTYITKNVSLQALRHTFGSTLLRHGVAIEVVSKLMGHANITITYNIYTFNSRRRCKSNEYDKNMLNGDQIGVRT
ncbi:MAG: tyrosine-type recombinase/integrase [Roseburia sp.]|nr:tyrosine-type recombinase/integrase [Roseburia sp.]